ncbi:MAG: LuxR C-terminal-related transcriptional regulator [bacterium]|jgi:DNA-binding CsgD family transcriptional regulator
MEQQTLNLSDPGVLEALCDDDAMRAWYRLRMSVHPLSASEVAEGVRLELGPTHSALDRLEAAALIRKLPARGSRRVISYQAMIPELRVLIPDDWRQDDRSVQLAAAFMRRDQALLDRAKRMLQSTRKEWFFEQVTPIFATKEEFEELQRRVNEVGRYVMELAGRTRGPEELVEIPTRHVVQLRIAPLEGEMPPIAEIRVGTRRSFEIAQGDRTATPSTLGAREVEIARLLQSGLSRPEVAARLGISAQTVSTYCKRMFEKLGIRRAIELNRFSFESAVGKPPRARRAVKA